MAKIAKEGKPPYVGLKIKCHSCKAEFILETNDPVAISSYPSNEYVTTCPQCDNKTVRFPKANRYPFKWWHEWWSVVVFPTIIVMGMVASCVIWGSDSLLVWLVFALTVSLTVILAADSD